MLEVQVLPSTLLSLGSQHLRSSASYHDVMSEIPQNESGVDKFDIVEAISNELSVLQKSHGEFDYTMRAVDRYAEEGDDQVVRTRVYKEVDGREYGFTLRIVEGSSRGELESNVDLLRRNVESIFAQIYRDLST